MALCVCVCGVVCRGGEWLTRAECDLQPTNCLGGCGSGCASCELHTAASSLGTVQCAHHEWVCVFFTVYVWLGVGCVAGRRRLWS